MPERHRDDAPSTTREDVRMRTPGDHVGSLIDSTLTRVFGPVQQMLRELQAAGDRLASQALDAIEEEEALR
jgi:hypothetical protein